MTLFCACCLFQQYIVDAWAICDQNKLDWICRNQEMLRADLYNGLADAMLCQDVDTAPMGR